MICLDVNIDKKVFELQVTVHDPLLVSVVHRVANLGEEIEPGPQMGSALRAARIEAIAQLAIEPGEKPADGG